MNPYFLAGGLLAVMCAFGGGYWKGHADGKAKVQQAWDAERLVTAEQHAKDEAAAREKERQMQADADRLRKDKDAEIRDTAARAAALANQLRYRPERAPSGGGMPATAGAGSPGHGCTGRELSRPDAEFLAGEAARADELRASLKQCIAQYEALKR